jgi:hypothetical protein
MSMSKSKMGDHLRDDKKRNPRSGKSVDLEWRKIEWVASVLGLEHTEEQTVGPKENASPDQHRQLLSLDIFHARHL